MKIKSMNFYMVVVLEVCVEQEKHKFFNKGQSFLTIESILIVVMAAYWIIWQRINSFGQSSLSADGKKAKLFR